MRTEIQADLTTSSGQAEAMQRDDGTAVELRQNGAVVEDRVSIAADVSIDAPNMFEVREDSTIAAGTRVLARGGVSIGRRVVISPGAQILSETPSIPRQGRPISSAAPQLGAIEIADDAWIGPGVIILPGVRVGESAVVLAGSVVSSNVPASLVVRGNPATYHTTRAHI